MGLLNRTYDTDATFDPRGQKTHWERFAYYIKSLNDHSDKDTQYKVLYLARHGEGYHNVAQAYYGSECCAVRAVAIALRRHRLTLRLVLLVSAARQWDRVLVGR